MLSCLTPCGFLVLLALNCYVEPHHNLACAFAVDFEPVYCCLNVLVGEEWRTSRFFWCPLLYYSPLDKNCGSRNGGIIKGPMILRLSRGSLFLSAPRWRNNLVCGFCSMCQLTAPTWLKSAFFGTHKNLYGFISADQMESQSYTLGNTPQSRLTGGMV